MSNNYYDYCEKIWNDWLENKKKCDDNFEKYFQYEYCPEPYLRFTKSDEKSEMIYFLTTNPGGGFEIQDRELVLKNKSIINCNDTYYNNSKYLAEYYNSNLIGGSKNRIKHMIYLSKGCGYNSFRQIESIPFHSKNLKDKNSMIKLMKGNNRIISDYVDATKEYLKDKNVIAIQAVGYRKINELSNWIKLQCEIIGLDINKSKYISICQKVNEDTAGIYIEKQKNCIKILSLRVGQNDLPSEEGCNIIGNEYKKLTNI